MVAPFIPMTAAEIAWEERYKLSYHGRVTLWSFGGIVEDVAGCGQGWCWYEKGQMVNQQQETPPKLKQSFRSNVSPFPPSTKTDRPVSVQASFASYWTPPPAHCVQSVQPR